MLRVSAVVLLAAFFLSSSADGIAQSLSSVSDLAGLYRLRSSLGLRARDWPRRSDPCTTWVGVGCDGAGRIVSLDLSGLQRTRLGRLNPLFAVDGLQNLTKLRSFNATGFALPGPIPDWFGSLLPPTLAVLDLRSAAVSGAIPYSIGGAVSFVILSLAGNAITGDIPPTIGQLSNLTVLDLSHNALSGRVPSVFASLSNLSYLDLSSNFLSGPVPPELSTLQGLKTLILANNRLSGEVPPQLGNLSSLTELDLSFNLLSGSVPNDLKNLRSLQDLNLGNNSLSGVLPETLFSGLSQLRSLRLCCNNLSGALPNSIWSLSQLQVLDVSYNNFTGVLPDLTPRILDANPSGLFDLSSNLYYGSIPLGFVILFGRLPTVDISDNYFRGSLPAQIKSKILSFRLNCFSNATGQRNAADCSEFYAQKGLTLNEYLSQSSLPSSSKKNHRLTYILVGAIGGGVLLLALLLLLVCWIWRCGGRQTEQREASRATVPSGGSIQAPGVSKNLSDVGQAFSYDQLVQATTNFSEANLIKHGHSGDIYQGTLEDGLLVVIKRIDVQKVRKDAHLTELDLFSRGLHERLAPFLGHCLDLENEKFLVYRYVPNGDLSASLHRKPGQEEESVQSLDWIKRLKIATGVAEALCYLHHACTPPIIHRDLQSSSILLDDKFEVRLGSLSEVSTQEGEGHQNVISRLFRFSVASEQSVTGPPAFSSYDIYCFGKVLLELVTGKLGISGSNYAATNEWIEQTLVHIQLNEKELVTRIIDPFLVVDEDHLEEVWAVAIVAKSCLNPKASKRPPMRYILKALENPLKVVREEENDAGPARLRTTSSRGFWNAAFRGSWRQSSSEVTSSAPGQARDDQMFKRSGTMRSQGSINGENSFSRRRPSKEIFPEPYGGACEVED